MKRIAPVFFMVISFCGYGQTNVSDILENTLAGVVTVGIYETSLEKQLLGFRGETEISLKAYERALDLGDNNSSGSGFVIQKNGVFYIITNAHVVEYASDEPGSILVYSVTRASYKAKLIGGDSFYDVAVLTFIDQPGPEIVPIEFKTTPARIGERVFAIGNPSGEFPYSVSDGIISAKNRARNGITGKHGFLQTTATVFYGNSGGPLVDSEGKVTGINTQIQWSLKFGEWIWLPQINFALEGELVQRLVNEIIQNNGRVIRAYLGIKFTEDYAYNTDNDGYGWYSKKDELPKISKVIPYSPASRNVASKIDYSVESVNGEPVRNIEELLGALEDLKPKQTVTLGIIKDGKKETVSVLTEELGTRQLENIASTTIVDDPSLRFEITAANTSLTLDASKLEDAYVDSTTIDKTKGMHKYNIVAAGFIEDGDDQVFIIKSSRDLGATIKLTGLSGILDFYLIQDKDKTERLKIYHYQYSRDAAIKRKTLFY